MWARRPPQRPERWSDPPSSKGALLFYVELLINGVLVGTLYALIALGFVLIYKASDAINFAQGEFVMFAGYVLAASLQLYGFPLVWAIVLGFASMILIGYLVERVVLQHLIGRPVVAVIMATIGLAAFLQWKRKSSEHGKPLR